MLPFFKLLKEQGLRLFEVPLQSGERGFRIGSQDQNIVKLLIELLSNSMGSF